MLCLFQWKNSASTALWSYQKDANINKEIRTSLVAAAETVAADVCWQFLAKCVDKRTQKTGSNTEAE